MWKKGGGIQLTDELMEVTPPMCSDSGLEGCLIGPEGERAPRKLSWMEERENRRVFGDQN